MIKLRKCSECETEKYATEKWKTCSGKCRAARKRRLDKIKVNENEKISTCNNSIK